MFKKRYVKKTLTIVTALAMTLTATAIKMSPAKASQVYTDSAYPDVGTQYPTTIINGGFETNPITGYQGQVDQSEILGWNTSEDDGLIEIWKNGFKPAGTGVHGFGHYTTHDAATNANNVSFAEINATANATLYQDIATVPGGLYMWSLWHGGRVSEYPDYSVAGTDTMQVLIGKPGQVIQKKENNPNAQSSYPVQPDSLYLKDTSNPAGGTNWGQHYGYYTAKYYVTRFAMQAYETQFNLNSIAESPGSTDSVDQSMGNLVDDVTWIPVAEPTVQEWKVGMPEPANPTYYTINPAADAYWNSGDLTVVNSGGDFSGANDLTKGVADIPTGIMVTDPNGNPVIKTDGSQATTGYTPLDADDTTPAEASNIDGAVPPTVMTSSGPVLSKAGVYILPIEITDPDGHTVGYVYSTVIVTPAIVTVNYIDTSVDPNQTVKTISYTDYNIGDGYDVQPRDENGGLIAVGGAITVDGKTYDYNGYDDNADIPNGTIDQSGDDITVNLFMTPDPPIADPVTVTVLYVDTTDGSALKVVSTVYDNGDDYDYTPGSVGDTVAFNGKNYTYDGYDENNDVPAGTVDSDKTIVMYFTPVTHTLTVNYVDENGDAIPGLDSTTESGKPENSDYTVPTGDKTVGGQTYEYTGLYTGSDALDGYMDEDKTVTLVYKLKTPPPVTTYSLTVNYVDENGAPIPGLDSTYTPDLSESSPYTVTTEDKNVGGQTYEYKYLYQGSDSLNGYMDGNKTVTLVYRLYTPPITTPAPTPEATPTTAPTVTPTPIVTLTPAPAPTATPTPAPTATPEPTKAPQPTSEPVLDVTPEPVNTQEPAASPEPAATPEPSLSAEPVATPIADQASASETAAPALSVNEILAMLDTVDPADGKPVTNNGRNYIVVDGDDGIVFIFDENGVPLGYLQLSPDETLDEINFEDEMIALGAINPETGGASYNELFPALVFMLSGIGLTASLLIRRKRTNNQ